MRWTYEDHKQEAATREAIARKRREGVTFLRILRRGDRAGRTTR